MEPYNQNDKTGPLEDRLRSMILQNVTMNPETTNHQNVPSLRSDSHRSRWGTRQRISRSGSRKNNHQALQSEDQQTTNATSLGDKPVKIAQRGTTRARGSSQHINRDRTLQHFQPPQSTPSHYAPLNRIDQSSPEKSLAQSQFLEHVASQVLPEREMSQEEIQIKYSFKDHLSQICQRAAIEHNPRDPTNLTLVCFGSLSSGFALPGSDMDLAIMASQEDPALPRVLQKALLDHNFGARLLTRTRVSILKICEQPGPALLTALREDRRKWDELTPEEQERYDRTGNAQEEKPEDDAQTEHEINTKTEDHQRATVDVIEGTNVAENSLESSIVKTEKDKVSPKSAKQSPRKQRPWYREKSLGPLDFPKTGVGIQCDINFSSSLGVHNTALLRCYSHCDVRVRLMVIFIKAWAARRKINSAYNGTLSSYGYVLMVLHFLVNVAQPPVCPNLQLARHRFQGIMTPSDSYCDNYNIQFWRNEAEIQSFAAEGKLTRNRQPLGELLREFFLYYARQGRDVPLGGFLWTHNVLSLRTPGGIREKREKGWTGARKTYQNSKEIRHRYLFAIEDPFELDHNVARTVTHQGIVAIRDEFRRTWRILVQVGNDSPNVDDLFAEMDSKQPPPDEVTDSVSGPSV